MSAGASVIQLGSSIVQGVAGIQNAENQADALIEQQRYTAKITEINTKLANYQAEDAIARGDQEASNLKSQVNKIVSAQQASFAASGIDVSSGIAEKLATETRILGEMDAVKIKNNAWREAFGYKTEALSNSLQGKVSAAAATNNANNTLIAGGLQAAGDISRGVYNFYK